MYRQKDRRHIKILIQLVAVVAIVFAGVSLSWSGSPSDPKLTLDAFKDQITKAYRNGDSAKMRQLSASHIDLVRPLVDELLRSSFGSDLRSEDGKVEEYMSFAYTVAKLKKEISKEDLLVKRIKHYRSWSVPERMVKSEADRLSSAAGQAFNEGLYGEVAVPGKKALDLYRRLPDVAGEVETLHYLGQAERKMANYDEAIRTHNRALLLAKKELDRMGQGQALIDLGDVYERKKEYSKAIELYNKALAVLRPEEDWREMGRALCQLGDIYVASADFGNAHDSYSRALHLAEKGQDPIYVARFSDCLGFFYRQLGDYDKAIEYHKRALESAGHIADVTTRVQARARALNHLGLCMEKLAEWSLIEKGGASSAKLYREAIEYERQALECAVGINDRWRKGYIMRALSQLHRELGAILPDGERLPQYQLSLQWAEEALALSASSMGEKEWTGLALHHKFRSQAALGRDEECLRTFQETVKVWESIGDLMSLGRTYQYLAQSFYEPRNDYEGALATYDRAIKAYAQVHALEYIAAIHLSNGVIYERRGEIEKAKKAYMTSIETMESMRSRLTSEEQKLTFFARRSKPYEALISLLIKSYRKQSRLEDGVEAFYVSEQAKAKIFQEMLAKAGARRVIGRNNPRLGQYVNRERQLVDHLTQYRNLLSEAMNKPEAGRDHARIETLEKDLTATQTGLVALEREIEKNFPEYGDLKRPRLKTVQELQEKILKPGEVVVSYFITEDNLIAWVISAKDVHITITDIKGSDLKNKIRSFKSSLEKAGRTGDIDDLAALDVKAGNELYGILVKPLEEQIKEAEILYISADDVLYTLPFEALIKDGPETEALIRKYEDGRLGKGAGTFDYDRVPFLLKDRPISYLPSVSVLYSVRTFLKDGYGKWREPLVAFADPVFCPQELKTKGKDVFLNRGASFALMALRGSGSLADSDPCIVLPRLSETADEVRAIAKTLNARKKPFLRENAKETVLKTIDLKPYRFVTIATHGLLAGEFRANQPSLVLSLVGDAKNDGLLEMDEVLGLDIDAELVTLSACNTSAAEGGTDKGEGFVGLTRSFMFAGTPSVLVTHWSVESETTRDLMIRVHQMITAKGRARALRDAKVDIMGKYINAGGTRISTAHPFFWAGFVLVGDGR